MDAHELIHLGLRGYLAYYGGFLVRYFAVAGGLYCFFHMAFKQRWLAHRIQQAFPPAGQLRYEIGWSLLNAACTGLSTLLLNHFIVHGQTSMYFGLAEHGWAYVLVSIALCIAGYDTWIYWQHRLMHTPWLFRHFHSIHHRVTNPTAFGAFSQHPIETFAGNVYFVLFVMFVPLHPLALGAVGLYFFLFAIVAHMGYELYPHGFTRHRIFQWINTSTHHNLHHGSEGCNYGLCFNYWDRLMGTNHYAYHETFEAITAAAQASSGGSAQSRRVETQAAMPRIV